MLRAPAVLVPAIAIALAPAVSARQSPRNASYTLSATLDPVNHLLLGRGELVWRNISSRPASELRFHLYWNAWRDPSSTWMRERRLAMNGAVVDRPAEDRGSIDVTSLGIVTGTDVKDLLAGAHYVSPDDGNADDGTVLAVPLDRPVAPGESITIRVAWNDRVPRTYLRTGVIGRDYVIAQWFPKIGVLEEAGWNCHQFHYSTEFFADFGDYDVTLTTPAGWIVGATGLEQPPAAAPAGAQAHRFVEHDVHDFAWTASPSYLDERRHFDLPVGPAVDVRLLLQPEHRDLADRYFAAARAGLERLNGWLVPYPYGHLTIVDPVTIVNPASQGGDTSGMEYPTLIVGGARWIVPWADDEVEDVVIHELAHQYVYGIIATDEVDRAWMDEGFATYLTARVLADAYPNRFVQVRRYFGGLIPWPYDDAAWARDLDGSRLPAYRRAPVQDVQSTDSWRYWPASAGATTYSKTALWLLSLERLVGPDTMHKVLSTYAARGAFRHPSPDDFFSAAHDASGQDLGWFFDAVYRSAATFDYAVGGVIEEPTATGAEDSTIIVRRLGDGIFPVDVRVAFDDDSSVVEHWDGRDRWRALRYRRNAHVTSVEVDPDRVLTLDENYTNNSWSAAPRTRQASGRWALRWLGWFEHLLMTYAFFA